MGVEDDWLAYCIDSTVYMFGSALKAELQDVEGKNKKEIQRKSERIISQWLDIPMKYRSPMAATQGIEEQYTVKGGS